VLTAVISAELGDADRYTEVGDWQRLSLRNVDQLVPRKVRVLRAQFGPFDASEPFLDQLLLNVYGGQGITKVWIDEPSVEGFVAARSADGVEDALPSPLMTPRGADAARAMVRVEGRLLLVQGRPFFPRVIEHRGEQLETLRRLGFNVISLDRPPGRELLEQARQLNLWFVSPPPSSLGKGSPLYDRVLAWLPTPPWSQRGAKGRHDWIAEIRRTDPLRRPVICYPPPSEASGLGAEITLLDWEWDDDGSAMSSGGQSRERPVWVRVPVRHSASLRRQIEAIDPSPGTPLPVSHFCNLQRVLHGGLGRGATGFWFVSDTNLESEADSASHLRSLLELLSRDLLVVEPWGAAGKELSLGAASSDPNVSIVALTTGRAQLILVDEHGSPSGAEECRPAPRPLRFTIPVAAQATEAFELTGNQLRPLDHTSTVGGIDVVVPNFAETALVVLTPIPQVVDRLAATLAAARGRRAQLVAAVARFELQALLGRRGQGTERSGGAASPVQLGASLRTLAACELAVARRDHVRAQQLGLETLSQLEHLRRALIREARHQENETSSSPLLACAELLPLHLRLSAMLRHAPSSGNTLPGGDFEEIEWLARAGWRQFQNVSPGLETSVGLSVTEPKSGRHALRMWAAGTAPSGHVAGELPLVSVSSPPISLRRGDIARLTGYARIPLPLDAATRGLTIADSLGRGSISLHLYQTSGWHRFTVDCIADCDRQLTFCAALDGAGEAFLDELTVKIFHVHDRTVVASVRP
jgi:hypothetical protein